MSGSALLAAWLLLASTPLSFRHSTPALATHHSSLLLRHFLDRGGRDRDDVLDRLLEGVVVRDDEELVEVSHLPDRKSTRLNSSHRCISYAVFCLKKKIRTARRNCDVFFPKIRET